LLDVYYLESETSEFYVSVLLNRATGRNMIMYSTEEEWILKKLQNTHHLIFTEEIDPSVGLQGFQARRIAWSFWKCFQRNGEIHRFFIQCIHWI
jgi:succinyl-CoA synthetase beta subunit